MNALIAAPLIAAAATVTAALIGPVVLTNLQNRRSKAIAEACKRNFEILEKLDKLSGPDVFKRDLTGVIGLQLNEIFEADAALLLQRRRDWILALCNAYLALPFALWAIDLWPPRNVAAIFGFTICCAIATLSAVFALAPIIAPNHPMTIYMSESAFWNNKKLKSSPGDTCQDWPKMREWLLSRGYFTTPQELERKKNMARTLLRLTKNRRISPADRRITRRR